MIKLKMIYNILVGRSVAYKLEIGTTDKATDPNAQLIIKGSKKGAVFTDCRFAGFGRNVFICGHKVQTSDGEYKHISRLRLR